MINDLIEIEIAYNLIKDSNDETKEDPIDHHYNKLKCKINCLDSNSDEYKLIVDYLQNTHASTHSYKLEVEDVFHN